MQVKNRLPRAGTDVEHSPVAILDAALACDISGGEVAVADQFGILCRRLFQSADVLFGNHQHMGRSLRINIVKRIRVFVFVHFLGRYFPAYDSAKQTIVHNMSIVRDWRHDAPNGGEVARTGKARAPLYPIGGEICSAVMAAHSIQFCARESKCLSIMGEPGSSQRTDAGGFTSDSNPSWSSVEPYQENRTLRSLSVVRDFFSAFAIVVLYPDSHPPVADWAAETLHFRCLIAMG